jgi:hypothetical protein
MDSGDRRTEALLSALPDGGQRELMRWLLAGLDAIEQTDFGDLEPAGVGGPPSPSHE